MQDSAAIRKRAIQIVRKLAKQYPDAHCALHYETPLELLIATILSAQCTDVRVNMVTPHVFRKYRTANDYAQAKPGQLERMIASTGFFRNKARNIIACCRKITDEHLGEVPQTMDALVALPGVGRKTANVVLGNAYAVPGITVDTHVLRLSRRMGLTKHTDPQKVEQDLMRLVPKKQWTMFSHRMIFHGRQVCLARRPLCESCVLFSICPKIGVAPKPVTK
jgi:endonuclease-3